MWKGDPRFFLPAVPSALLLHSVTPPSATQAVLSPRAAGHPSPPSPTEMPQKQMLPLCPMPGGSARDVSPQDVHVCIKGLSWAKVVWVHHWGNCPGPGPGHPAMSPCWHSDTTLGSHRLWAHPFQSQVAPHIPPALLRPLAPFRTTLAESQGCSSFSATMQGEQSCLFSKPCFSSCFGKAFRAPDTNSLTNTGAVAIGAVPFQGLIPEVNPYFRPNILCFPPAQPFPLSQLPKQQLVS